MTPRSIQALLNVATAAYWHLAWNWQSHLFEGVPGSFNMDVFAPEARDMMNNVDQELFDALVVLSRALEGKPRGEPRSIQHPPYSHPGDVT